MRHYITHIHLLGLFLVALATRLLYLKIASDSVGFDQVVTLASDSEFYRQIGDHIFGWHENGSYGLLRMGPGYAVILAMIKFVIGANPIWPTMFSILMGALAPVMVYVLAHQLMNSRAVALLAGGFTAVSLTSVALSCHILTDQPFFTFHAAALVCFVQGYRSGRIRWYVASGLIAGCAAYIRPVGQIWPPVFLFLPLILPLGLTYKSRWDLIRRGSVAGLVMLLMIFAWSTRNYVTHDLFVFGTNGVLTVRSYLLAQAAEETWGEKKLITDYRNQWEEEDGDNSRDFALSYNNARTRILSEFKKSPSVIARMYANNIFHNMVTGNPYVRAEIPQLRRFMAWLNPAVKLWLGLTLIGLTFLGLLIMILRRQRAAAWILGATYVSFSILLGASFWQGSRLHYSAEMAWSIIIAYLFVETIRFAARAVRRLAVYSRERL